MIIVIAPVLLFSGIYISIGTYFLFSHFRIPAIRSNHTLWFVAACFQAVIYNATRIGMYTSTSKSVELFGFWVWMAHVMIPVLAIAIAGFLNHYARDDKKWITRVIQWGFGVLALTVLFGREYTFKVDSSYYGAIELFGATIPRYRAEEGVIIIALYGFLLFSICYCLFHVFFWGFKGEKRDIWALIWGMSALFMTVVFDIVLGWKPFPCIFLGEYGFFFLILAMCYSTVNQIASLKKVDPPKPRKTGEDDLLKDIDTVSLESKLITLMREQMVFKDSRISLEALANHLSLSTQKFSRFLNQVMNCDFRNFVNKYRIEEAKRLLLQEPDLSIKYICFEVGFQSKSTFHDAFKRFTGTTPTLFRKNCTENPNT